MKVISPEVRFWAMVEKSDDHWLWTGSLMGRSDDDRYGQFQPGRRGTSPVGAHRFSYELAYGPIPNGYQVDHDYRCPKRCVRPTHLRLTTNKQNHENYSNPRGACYDKATGRWAAAVKHNYQRYWLGRFDTKEEALKAAQLKRLELFTHNDSDREE